MNAFYLHRARKDVEVSDESFGTFQVAIRAPPPHFAASHLNDHGDSTLFNISEPQFPYLIRGANF